MPGEQYLYTISSVLIKSLQQYVKQEILTVGENGKEARATRLITERASRRIGQMAFDLAAARPRKVRTPCNLQFF